jgi:acetyl esterase/lipase
MSWAFLLGSVIGAWFTYNAFRPRYAPAWRAGISFIAGWLTTELALHHILWQALLTAIFVAAGALEAWPGWLALAITMVSWFGLASVYRSGRDAERAVEYALQHAFGSDYRTRMAPGVGRQLAPTIDWKQIAVPFPIRHPDVERLRDITYARTAGLNLKLDIYRLRHAPEAYPTLLQIHGGAWVVGTKNEQGLPLMTHLAARGWICVSVNYRLSPHATFPEQVIDLKRAIAWIRDHGREYGANPDFLVLTGGSAGGHLAALVALTANDPALQPGFEGVDTSVAGCVAFYGVYDFMDRQSIWPHQGLQRLLERQVIKAARHEAPEVYEAASPLSRLHPGAPPFLVIHGDRDTVVPVEEARRFCAAFRRHAHDQIAYAEIPGAQHAFEIFPSPRAMLVIHGVERYLAYLYSRYLETEPGAQRPRP